MKKLVSVLLTMSLLFGLAACGNSGGSDNSKAKEEGEMKKEIEYWVNWTPGEQSEKDGLEAIEKFEEATGYKVNYSVLTYDMLHDKLLAAAAGGNSPDIATGLPEYLGEFYNMGILEDITEDVNTWKEKEKINQAVFDAVSIDGKIYGVPNSMTVRGYLAHDSVFKAAGVAVPESWDDLLALEGFKEETGSYPLELTCSGVRASQDLLIFLAEYDLKICDLQSDGKYKNTWLDNEEELKKAAKVFQFYKDCIDKGIVDPSSKTWGWEETDSNYANVASASHISGNWMKEFENNNPEGMEDVTINPVPAPADGHSSTYIEVKPLFIFNSAKNKEGALEFARFLLGDEMQQNAAESGQTVRNDIVVDNKWASDFSPLAENGVVFPSVTLSGVTQAMQDSLAELLQNGKTPMEAAEWLSNAINSSLAETGELSE